MNKIRPVDECRLGMVAASNCEDRAGGDCHKCIYHVSSVCALGNVQGYSWWTDANVPEPLYTLKERRKKIVSPPVDPKIKFTYLYFDNSPVVTIATRVEDLDPDCYHYGVSFCSVNDRPDKRIGREIAVDRLLSSSDDSSFPKG